MQNLGQLSEADGRYEFRCPEMSLVVRGDHPEWVLLAAYEILATTAKNESDSKIDELKTLQEFEEATEMDIFAEESAAKERFEIIPQCVVQMGRMDYKWTAADGRDKLTSDYDGFPIRRIVDMSLTKNDSFLKNEDGVDMANDTK
ncbi:MAG: hypothetical protein AAF871_03945 [Pseudomonadota bacterium]